MKYIAPFGAGFVNVSDWVDSVTIPLWDTAKTDVPTAFLIRNKSEALPEIVVFPCEFTVKNGTLPDEIKNTFVPILSWVDPVTVKDPDMVMSYASIPVNASTDWDTCHGLTTPRDTMDDLSSIFAICFSYKYL